MSELQHYDWGAVAPLLVLAFGAILVLLLEVGISRSALGGDAASRARRERRLGLVLGMVASGALLATMALAFASLSSVWRSPRSWTSTERCSELHGGSNGICHPAKSFLTASPRRRGRLKSGYSKPISRRQ